MKSANAQIIYSGEKSLQLNEIDQKILTVLATNSRTPTTVIAKLLKISQERVFYRLGKLKERKIIVDYFTTFNLEKLGIRTYMVFLQFAKLNKTQEDKLLAGLRANQHVSWVSTAAGQFDLILFVQAPSNIAFEEHWSDISTKFGSSFRNVSISILTEQLHCSPLYPVNTKAAFQRKVREASLPYSNVKPSTKEKINVDKTDLEIMFKLQLNSREKLIDIARSLSISAQAVEYRIKKLKSTGIIRSFYYRPNYHILDYQYYTVRVKFVSFSKQLRAKFQKFAQAQKSIFVLLRMIGSWDFSLHVFFRNSRELNGFLNEIREQFGETIDCIDTSMHLDQHLYTYFSDHTKKYLKQQCKK